MPRRPLPNLALALALASTLAMPQLSAAAIVTSNQADCHAGVGRIFSVEAQTVLRCLQAGAGNINGNNAGDAALLASGWVYVDASNNMSGAHDGWLSANGSLTSGIAGDFRIDPLAWSSYDRVAIGLKSGVAQTDPDWAIFELADDTLNGLWRITGSRQALSHAILYGRGSLDLPQLDLQAPQVGRVVEPPLWALTLLAAVGLMWAQSRRRRQSEA